MALYKCKDLLFLIISLWVIGVCLFALDNDRSVWPAS